jgi:hypothetical protein
MLKDKIKKLKKEQKLPRLTCQTYKSGHKIGITS